MQNRIEPPDGILITLPKKFFEEHDHATYLEEIRQMNIDESMIWYRMVRNPPVLDFAYVYTVIDNKIHHRSQFAGIERNKTHIFSRPNGGRKAFLNMNWILMCGPVVFPPYEFPMKGFQGFRYTQKIF